MTPPATAGWRSDRIGSALRGAIGTELDHLAASASGGAR